MTANKITAQELKHRLELLGFVAEIDFSVEKVFVTGVSDNFPEHYLRAIETLGEVR